MLTIQARQEPEPAPGAKPKPPKPVVLDRYRYKQDIQGFISASQPHLFLFDLATKKLSKLIGVPDTGPTSYAEGQAEWGVQTGNSSPSSATSPRPIRTA